MLKKNLALGLAILAVLLVSAVVVQGWLVPAFQNWMSASALTFRAPARWSIEIGRQGTILVPAFCLLVGFGLWRARADGALGVLVVQVATLVVVLFLLLQGSLFFDLALAFHDHPGRPAGG